MPGLRADDHAERTRCGPLSFVVIRRHWTCSTDPLHNLKCGEGEQGEMRKVLIGSIVLAACVVCGSQPAVAQVRQRVPHAQSIAAGLDGAAFVPSSKEGDQLDSAPMVSGFVEYYPTARLSLRGSAGFTQPAILGSP